MSLFKIKSNKNFTFDNRTSLHAKHREYIEHVQEKRATIPVNQERISELQEKREEIERRLANIQSSRFTTRMQDLILEQNRLDSEIEKLETEINDLESKESLNNYYLDLASIYIKFDDNKENTPNTNTNFGDIVNLKCKSNRERVLDAYLQKFGTTKDESLIDVHSHDMDDDDVCNNPKCRSRGNFEVNNGLRVCRSCGELEYIISEVSKPSYKDNNTDKVYSFSYKKINHWNEWINQIQGKEITKIPDDVFEQLRREITKERITNSKHITQKRVRGYLKKLKLNKYYEHVPYITLQLGGERPPQIPPKIEATLRKMFIEISAPFIKYCPKDRRNFPRYTYILYKCCELIGYDELLPYLPLLKTRQRLNEMDKIWKKICEDQDLEFRKTL